MVSWSFWFMNCYLLEFLVHELMVFISVSFKLVHNSIKMRCYCLFFIIFAQCTFIKLNFYKYLRIHEIKKVLIGNMLSGWCVG